ncbi:MAG: DedA family protein [Rubrobacteraceae bacterium]
MTDLLDVETVREVLDLIARYGYVFVLLGTLFQSVGLPLPAQTILLTAGVMAGQGILDPIYAMAIGLAGAVAGSQIGYLAGRKGGRPFVLRWGRYVGLTPARLDYADKFFSRRQRRVVLTARFIPVLKTFGYLAAGLNRMPYRKFLRYDIIGTTVWAVGSVLLGYFISSSVMSLVE